MIMRRRTAVLGGLLLATGLVTGAQAKHNRDSLRYAPEKTTVALVPAVNASGEKWDEARAKQTRRATDEMRRDFEARGFRVLEAADVEDAVKATDADLNDEEQQNRATLFRIGREAKADLVAFAVITDVRQEPLSSGANPTLEGKARVKVWLLDVRDELPLLSARTFEGGSRDGLIRGSERIIRAVGFAARNALKEFLKPYPVQSKG